MEYSWFSLLVMFVMTGTFVQKKWDRIYPVLRRIMLVSVYYLIQLSNKVGVLKYISPQTYFEHRSNKLIYAIENMFAKKGLKIQCIQVEMDVPLMRLIFVKDKEKLLPAYEKTLAYLIDKKKLPGETYVRFERGCLTMLLPSEWFGLM